MSPARKLIPRTANDVIISWYSFSICLKTSCSSLIALMLITFPINITNKESNLGEVLPKSSAKRSVAS